MKAKLLDQPGLSKGDDPLPWLLEPDPENPGVRYFALTQLLDKPLDDTDVQAAQAGIMHSGPVPQILKAQHPEGYWVEPGPGYYPKYTGTVWQLIFLAQLGADGRDARVRDGCEHVLAHSRSPYGGFSLDGRPGGMIHCLQGNLAAALLDLGCWGDARLAEALEWLARSITGEGIARSGKSDAGERYYRSGNSGPGFCCSANNHLPCAWGAVKAMLALGKVPVQDRSPMVAQAIGMGAAFLLSRDPAEADYPMGFATKPSRSWFQFGYPIAYVTDVLQILEVLAALGFGKDPRLASALDLLLEKRDRSGRWKMAYSYNGKTWADVEVKGQPSKWVTLRVLHVLKQTRSSEI